MTRGLWAPWAIATGVSAAACTPGVASTTTTPEPSANVALAPIDRTRVDSVPDLARGARIFDDWVSATGSAFVPDDPHTASLDGKGGPFGNGTLPDAHGAPLQNAGHDYRLARLFGPELRGAHGSFAHCGPYAHVVLVPELLTDTDDAATWRERLRVGEDGIPAYGQVLDARALDDLVAFILAVREGVLPRPSRLFAPDAAEPCKFSFVAPGDVAHGLALHTQRCAGCHGAKGTDIPLGPDKQTLGATMRARAPAVWFVVLGGKAGSKMPGLLDEDLPRAELTATLSDLFSAYRDSGQFPDR